MRIGLFGGTFNPIHFGHLRTILEVQESFSIDTVYLVPSAIPPHKTQTGIADAGDRYRMIQLAISNQRGFRVSDVELDRPGPSYSIDTLSHFQSTLPTHAHLYLILGMDAFLEIDTWKAYADFFDRVPFIVMERAEMVRRNQGNATDMLQGFLQTNISDGYRFSSSCSGFVHTSKQTVNLARVTALGISASRIRHLIQKGRSIRYLVPDSVAEHIETKGLYR